MSYNPQAKLFYFYFHFPSQPSKASRSQSCVERKQIIVVCCVSRCATQDWRLSVVKMDSQQVEHDPMYQTNLIVFYAMLLIISDLQI